MWMPAPRWRCEVAAAVVWVAGTGGPHRACGRRRRRLSLWLSCCFLFHC